MPGDFKYQETKAPLLKDAYDEFLARIICYVFSVSPEPFVGQVNRATAESSQARAIAEGLGPLQRFVSSLMNRIIACELNCPDLEFIWQDTREQDPKDAAQIDVAYVTAGIITADEVRGRMGLTPLSKMEPPVSEVQKFNPNHDERGRFATVDNASGGDASVVGALGMDANNLPGISNSSNDKDSTSANTQESEVASDSSWGNWDKLQDHFDRHGNDFGAETSEEYAQKASDFLDYAKQEKLPMIEYNTGEIGVYEPSTNTFGVYTADGKTMSFYRPDRPNYFNNQIDRVNSSGGKVINDIASYASGEVEPAGAESTMLDRVPVSSTDVLGGPDSRTLLETPSDIIHSISTTESEE